MLHSSICHEALVQCVRTTLGQIMTGFLCPKRRIRRMHINGFYTVLILSTVFVSDTSGISIKAIPSEQLLHDVSTSIHSDRKAVHTSNIRSLYSTVNSAHMELIPSTVTTSITDIQFTIDTLPLHSISPSSTMEAVQSKLMTTTDQIRNTMTVTSALYSSFSSSIGVYLEQSSSSLSSSSSSSPPSSSSSPLSVLSLSSLPPSLGAVAPLSFSLLSSSSSTTSISTKSISLSLLSRTKTASIASSASFLSPSSLMLLTYTTAVSATISVSPSLSSTSNTSPMFSPTSSSSSSSSSSSNFIIYSVSRTATLSSKYTRQLTPTIQTLHSSTYKPPLSLINSSPLKMSTDISSDIQTSSHHARIPSSTLSSPFWYTFIRSTGSQRSDGSNHVFNVDRHVSLYSSIHSTHVVMVSSTSGISKQSTRATVDNTFGDTIAPSMYSIDVFNLIASSPLDIPSESPSTTLLTTTVNAPSKTPTHSSHSLYPSRYTSTHLRTENNVDFSTYTISSSRDSTIKSNAISSATSNAYSQLTSKHATTYTSTYLEHSTSYSYSDLFASLSSLSTTLPRISIKYTSSILSSSHVASVYSFNEPALTTSIQYSINTVAKSPAYMSSQTSNIFSPFELSTSSSFSTSTESYYSHSNVINTTFDITLSASNRIPESLEIVTSTKHSSLSSMLLNTSQLQSPPSLSSSFVINISDTSGDISKPTTSLSMRSSYLISPSTLRHAPSMSSSNVISISDTSGGISKPTTSLSTRSSDLISPSTLKHASELQTLTLKEAPSVSLFKSLTKAETSILLSSFTPISLTSTVLESVPWTPSLKTTSTYKSSTISSKILTTQRINISSTASETIKEWAPTVSFHSTTDKPMSLNLSPTRVYVTSPGSKEAISGSPTSKYNTFASIDISRSLLHFVTPSKVSGTATSSATLGVNSLQSDGEVSSTNSLSQGVLSEISTRSPAGPNSLSLTVSKFVSKSTERSQSPDIFLTKSDRNVISKTSESVMTVLPSRSSPLKFASDSSLFDMQFSVFPAPPKMTSTPVSLTHFAVTMQSIYHFDTVTTEFSSISISSRNSDILKSAASLQSSKPMFSKQVSDRQMTNMLSPTFTFTLNPHETMSSAYLTVSGMLANTAVFVSTYSSIVTHSSNDAYTNSNSSEFSIAPTKIDTSAVSHTLTINNDSKSKMHFDKSFSMHTTQPMQTAVSSLVSSAFHSAETVLSRKDVIVSASIPLDFDSMLLLSFSLTSFSVSDLFSISPTHTSSHISSVSVFPFVSPIKRVPVASQTSAMSNMTAPVATSALKPSSNLIFSQNMSILSLSTDVSPQSMVKSTKYSSHISTDVSNLQQTSFSIMSFSDSLAISPQTPGVSSTATYTMLTSDKDQFRSIPSSHLNLTSASRYSIKSISTQSTGSRDLDTSTGIYKSITALSSSNITTHSLFNAKPYLDSASLRSTIASMASGVSNKHVNDISTTLLPNSVVSSSFHRYDHESFSPLQSDTILTISSTPPTVAPHSTQVSPSSTKSDKAKSSTSIVNPFSSTTFLRHVSVLSLSSYSLYPIDSLLLSSSISDIKTSKQSVHSTSLHWSGVDTSTKINTAPIKAPGQTITSDSMSSQHTPHSYISSEFKVVPQSTVNTKDETENISKRVSSLQDGQSSLLPISKIVSSLQDGHISLLPISISKTIILQTLSLPTTTAHIQLESDNTAVKSIISQSAGTLKSSLSQNWVIQPTHVSSFSFTSGDSANSLPTPANSFTDTASLPRDFMRSTSSIVIPSVVSTVLHTSALLSTSTGYIEPIFETITPSFEVSDQLLSSSSMVSKQTSHLLFSTDSLMASQGTTKPQIRKLSSKVSRTQQLSVDLSSYRYLNTFIVQTRTLLSTKSYTAYESENTAFVKPTSTSQYRVSPTSSYLVTPELNPAGKLKSSEKTMSSNNFILSSNNYSSHLSFGANTHAESLPLSTSMNTETIPLSGVSSWHATDASILHHDSDLPSTRSLASTSFSSSSVGLHQSSFVSQDPTPSSAVTGHRIRTKESSFYPSPTFTKSTHLSSVWSASQYLMHSVISSIGSNMLSLGSSTFSLNNTQQLNTTPEQHNSVLKTSTGLLHSSGFSTISKATITNNPFTDKFSFTDVISSNNYHSLSSTVSESPLESVFNLGSEISSRVFFPTVWSSAGTFASKMQAPIPVSSSLSASFTEPVTAVSLSSELDLIAPTTTVSSSTQIAISKPDAAIATISTSSKYPFSVSTLSVKPNGSFNSPSIWPIQPTSVSFSTVAGVSVNSLTDSSNSFISMSFLLHDTVPSPSSVSMSPTDSVPVLSSFSYMHSSVKLIPFTSVIEYASETDSLPETIASQTLMTSIKPLVSTVASSMAATPFLTQITGKLDTLNTSATAFVSIVPTRRKSVHSLSSTSQNSKLAISLQSFSKVHTSKQSVLLTSLDSHKSAGESTSATTKNISTRSSSALTLHTSGRSSQQTAYLPLSTYTKFTTKYTVTPTERTNILPTSISSLQHSSFNSFSQSRLQTTILHTSSLQTSKPYTATTAENTASSVAPSSYISPTSTSHYRTHIISTLDVETKELEISWRMSTTLEIPSPTVDVPSSTAESSLNIEIPSSTVEKPSSTVEMMSSTVEMSSSTIEIRSSPVEILSSTIEIPSSTVEIPLSTFEIPLSIVDLPSSTVKISSSTVEILSSTVKILSSTVELSSSTVDIPSSTVEIPSSTVEIPSSIVDLPSSTVKISSSTVEILSSTVEIPSSTVDLSSSTVEIPSSTVDLSSSTVEIPSSTVEILSSTVEIPSSIVEIPSSTVDLLSSTVELLSSIVEIPSSPAEILSSTVEMSSSSTVDLLSSTVELLSSTVEIPSSPVELPSSTVEISSSTVGISSSAVEISSSTVNISSSTVELPSSTVELPSSPVELPSSTVEISSSTVDIPSSTVEISSSTVEIPLSTFEISPSTVELPLSTFQILSSTVKILSSTVGLSSSTVDIPSSTVEIPPSTVEILSSTVDLLSSSVELLSSIVEIPSSTVEIPSPIVEIPSSTVDLLSSSVELLSSIVEIPSSPVELPSSTVDISSSTVEISSSAVEISSSTVNISSSTVEIPSSTVELPLSTFQILSSTVKILSSTVELSSSTVDIPSSTVEIPPSTVEIPSSTVEISSSTVEISSSTVEISSSTVKIPSSTVDISSSPVEISSSTFDISSSPVEISSSTVDIPSSPVDISSSTAEISSSTVEILSSVSYITKLSFNSKIQSSSLALTLSPRVDTVAWSVPDASSKNFHRASKSTLSTIDIPSTRLISLPASSGHYLESSQLTYSSTDPTPPDSRLVDDMSSSSSRIVYNSDSSSKSIHRSYVISTAPLTFSKVYRSSSAQIVSTINALTNTFLSDLNTLVSASTLKTASSLLHPSATASEIPSTATITDKHSEDTFSVPESLATIHSLSSYSVPSSFLKSTFSSVSGYRRSTLPSGKLSSIGKSSSGQLKSENARSIESTSTAFLKAKSVSRATSSSPMDSIATQMYSNMKTVSEKTKTGLGITTSFTSFTKVASSSSVVNLTPLTSVVTVSSSAVKTVSENPKSEITISTLSPSFSEVSRISVLTNFDATGSISTLWPSVGKSVSMISEPGTTVASSSTFITAAISSTATAVMSSLITTPTITTHRPEVTNTAAISSTATAGISSLITTPTITTPRPKVTNTATISSTATAGMSSLITTPTITTHRPEVTNTAAISSTATAGISSLITTPTITTPRPEVTNTAVISSTATAGISSLITTPTITTPRPEVTNTAAISSAATAGISSLITTPTITTHRPEVTNTAAISSTATAGMSSLITTPTITTHRPEVTYTAVISSTATAGISSLITTPTITTSRPKVTNTAVISSTATAGISSSITTPTITTPRPEVTKANLLTIGIQVQSSFNVEDKTFINTMQSGLLQGYNEGRIIAAGRRRRDTQNVNYDVVVTSVNRTSEASSNVDVEFYVTANNVPIPATEVEPVFAQLSPLEMSAILTYPVTTPVRALLSSPPPEDQTTTFSATILYIIIGIPTGCVLMATIILGLLYCPCRRQKDDHAASKYWKQFSASTMRKPTLEDLDLMVDVERGEVINKDEAFDDVLPLQQRTDKLGDMEQALHKSTNLDSNMELTESTKLRNNDETTFRRTFSEICSPSVRADRLRKLGFNVSAIQAPQTQVSRATQTKNEKDSQTQTDIPSISGNFSESETLKLETNTILAHGILKTDEDKEDRHFNSYCSNILMDFPSSKIEHSDGKRRVKILKTCSYSTTSETSFSDESQGSLKPININLETDTVSAKSDNMQDSDDDIAAKIESLVYRSSSESEDTSFEENIVFDRARSLKKRINKEGYKAKQRHGRGINDEYPSKRRPNYDRIKEPKQFYEVNRLNDANKKSSLISKDKSKVSMTTGPKAKRAHVPMDGYCSKMFQKPGFTSLTLGKVPREVNNFIEGDLEDDVFKSDRSDLDWSDTQEGQRGTQRSERRYGHSSRYRQGNRRQIRDGNGHHRNNRKSNTPQPDRSRIYNRELYHQNTDVVRGEQYPDDEFLIDQEQDVHDNINGGMVNPVFKRYMNYYNERLNIRDPDIDGSEYAGNEFECVNFTPHPPPYQRDNTNKQRLTEHMDMANSNVMMVAPTYPRVCEHVAKMGRVGHRSGLPHTEARPQFRDLPFSMDFPAPPSSSSATTTMENPPKPPSPVQVRHTQRAPYEEMKLGRNMRAVPRGGIPVRSTRDQLDSDASVPLLHGSQPTNIVVDYYTNTRAPRGHTQGGPSIARAVTSPQHPSQELIETLNRNLSGNCNTVVYDARADDDQTSAFQKHQEELLRLRQQAERRQEEENRQRKLALEEERQRLLGEKEKEASERHREDIKTKDELLQSSFPLTNTFSAGANAALRSHSPPASDLLYSLGPDVRKQNTTEPISSQPFSPVPPVSYDYKGGKISSGYTHPATTESVQTQAQATVVQDDSIDEEIEGGDDKKSDDSDFF